MKLVTEAEEREMYARAIHGGLTGFLTSLAISSSAVLLLHRHSSVVRRLRLPFKAMIVTMCTSGGCVLQAEREVLRFDRELYHKDHLANRSKNASAQEQHTHHSITTDAAMSHRRPSMLREIRRYIDGNRWELIAGSWISGMVASGWYLHRQKYMNTTQKFVQARMYAQAITLAALLATAALATFPIDEDGQPEAAGVKEGRAVYAPRYVHQDGRHHYVDDSWKRIVEIEEQRLANLAAAGEGAAPSAVSPPSHA